MCLTSRKQGRIWRMSDSDGREPIGEGSEAKLYSRNRRFIALQQHAHKRSTQAVDQLSFVRSVINFLCQPPHLHLKLPDLQILPHIRRQGTRAPFASRPQFAEI